MADNKIEVTELPEHTVEIVTNSGEGAQKCAQIFGQTCAKMGNGVWTVEIIPAEIEPPSRHVTSTSGNIIRFGTEKVSNWGDQSKLVIAFTDWPQEGQKSARAVKRPSQFLQRDSDTIHTQRIRNDQGPIIT